MSPEQNLRAFVAEKVSLTEANKKLLEENDELRDEIEELRAMVELLKAQHMGRQGIVS
jgi:FtsZ-binding cell division protein ZapB